MTVAREALCILLEASAPEKRTPEYYRAVEIVGDALDDSPASHVRESCANAVDLEARAWAQFPAGGILKQLAKDIREGRRA